MKSSKVYLVIVFVCCLTMNKAFSQDIKDSVFTSVFRSNILTFRYKVVTASADNNSLKLTLSAISSLNKPYYILSKNDFTIYQRHVLLGHTMIDSLMRAVENLQLNDKMSEKVKIQLEDVIEKTNERAELYKNAYEEMILLNQAYSKQLADCVELQRKKPKAKGLQYFIWGMVGGGLIGTYVGFQAVR